jgi:hypothetical protein
MFWGLGEGLIYVVLCLLGEALQYLMIGRQRRWSPHDGGGNVCSGFVNKPHIAPHTARRWKHVARPNFCGEGPKT